MVAPNPADSELTSCLRESSFYFICLPLLHCFDDLRFFQGKKIKNKTDAVTEQSRGGKSQSKAKGNFQSRLQAFFASLKDQLCYSKRVLSSAAC